jgi:hypothetical protein
MLPCTASATKKLDGARRGLVRASVGFHKRFQLDEMCKCAMVHAQPRALAPSVRHDVSQDVVPCLDYGLET